MALSNKRRAQVVRALRAAADAIEAGAERHPDFRWLTDGIQGAYTHGTADLARRVATKETEFPDPLTVESWGVYVHVESTARCDTVLADAWKD